jgi:hypothetical protein
MMEANMAAGFETSFEQSSGAIYTTAGPDPIALLTPRAAERLRQLRLKASDLHAVMPEFADRYEANTARGDAERRLQRLLAHRSEGGFALRENDPQVIETRRQLEKLADEARRLEERYEKRSEQWQSAARVVQAVESYLRDGMPSGTSLEDHASEVPKLLKGVTITDAIERYRRRGRELKADLHRVQSAPYPSSYAKAQMRAQIEALAVSGAPNVANLIEHDRKIEWPTQTLQSSVYNTQVPAVAFAEMPDALALFAWTFKDQLIAALDGAIATEADDKAALSHEARQQQEAEVMGDLLAVERDESEMIWRGMAENLPVQHRSDCSILAILGCTLTTAPAVNGGGMSLMHAFGLRR